MCDRSWGVQDDLTGCQVDEDDWMPMYFFSEKCDWQHASLKRDKIKYLKLYDCVITFINNYTFVVFIILFMILPFLTSLLAYCSPSATAQ